MQARLAHGRSPDGDGAFPSAGAPVGVAVDGAGRIGVSLLSSAVDPVGIAQTLCQAMAPLLVAELRPVAVRTASEGGTHVGLAVIREETAGAGPARYRAGTATTSRPGDAAAAAVLRALVPGGSVFTAVAGRIRAQPGISGVTVLAARAAPGTETPDGAPDRDRRLFDATPGPGRLAVATHGGEHRVLRLALAGMVVSADRSAPVLALVESWMEAVVARLRA